MLTETGLRARLIKAVRDAGGMSRFAQTHGISVALVSYTLSGKRKPSAAIASALGYEAQIRFAPIRTSPLTADRDEASVSH